MRTPLKLIVLAKKATSAPSGPVLLAESRPGPFTPSRAQTTAGDSMVVGVGTSTSPTNYSWPSQMAALLTSPSLTRVEQGGMAFVYPAAGINTAPITTQITGRSSGERTNNDFMFDGGVNDYNTAVNPEPGAQNWAEFVRTNAIPTIAASMLGGSAQMWTYFSNMNAGGPGMANYADWRRLQRKLTTTYGANIFDIKRALMAKRTTNAADLDAVHFDNWFDLPLSFRGHSSTSLFAKTVETTWNTCQTTTAGVAGVEAVAPAAGYNEGDLMANIDPFFGVQGNNLYRKIGAAGGGNWAQIDVLHPSRWGYEAWASIGFDIKAAIQGVGAPVACPSELYCKQDVASGGSVGTIPYIGPAPATAAFFDLSGNPVTTLSITDNGSTNNKGTLSVTRSSTGTLTEGQQILKLQLTTAGGRVLHSEHDFYIGQPSTQTVPRLWLPPGNASLSDSDYTLVGRNAHGLTDGDKYFIGVWVKPVTLGGYIVALRAGHSNNTYLYLRLGSSGQFQIEARNAANTLLWNTNLASVFAANTATWLLVDLDFSVTNPTIKGYYNKAGAGADVAISQTAGAVGPTTLAMSKTIPRFLASEDATYWRQSFATAYASRGQFIGRYGNIIVGNGNVGIDGNPSLARTLWNLDNSPVARTPYATIGGIRPVFDIQGGPGDQAYGGFDPIEEPVFPTYRGAKGLTP